MKKPLVSLLLAFTAFTASAVVHAARDYINVVGSSTVYPFSTVVAERYGKTTKYRTPKIESTGSGGGLKLFCQGVGIQYPDITNASRRIKSSEVKMCERNGVKDIVEVMFGYDGIVLGNSVSVGVMRLSRKDIFLALAKQVPNPDGSETLIPNPYQTWRQINSSLPDKPIEVLGPPPTSGTRDAFAELALEGGCKQIPWIAGIKRQSTSKRYAGEGEAAKELENRYKAICHTVREDGAYVEAGENDNLIVQKLNANPDALGIFGFSFLDQNIDQIQGSMIDGFEPTFEAISAGFYPVSRPLYFYVKKAHVGVIPGIPEYLAEFTSKKAAGSEGYLTDKGMIPLDLAKRERVRRDVTSLRSLKL